MIHPETHLCTKKRGPRPAGPPDHCFYCKVKVGDEHLPDCVMRLRTVRLRITAEYVVTRPESWSEEQIDFHENESSWCKGNALVELKKTGGEYCLCQFAEIEFVREATPEDEMAWDLDFS